MTLVVVVAGAACAGYDELETPRSKRSVAYGYGAAAGF